MRRKLCVIVAAVLLCTAVMNTQVWAEILPEEVITEDSPVIEELGPQENSESSLQDPEAGTDIIEEIYPGVKAQPVSVVHNGLTVTGEPGSVEYTVGDGFCLVDNGSYTVSGTWLDTEPLKDEVSGRAVIMVKSGIHATVTLSNVDISLASGYGQLNASNCAIDMTGANVTMILKGDNVLKSGNYRAGIEAPAGSVLSIEGEGTLAAGSSRYGAGIGGGGIPRGFEGNCGEITIDGKVVVRAAGIDGACIGGGGTENDNGGNGGTVAVKRGTVIADASGSYNNAGIGGGKSNWGTGGSGADVTIDGNAVVIASRIGGGQSGGAPGTITRTKGVIIEGDSGKVYGDPLIETDIEIPSNKTVVVDNGQTLTVDGGATMTNYGTITNNGIIDNQGTINNYGVINGTGEFRGNPLNEASQVSLTVLKDDVPVSNNPIFCGERIRLKATVIQKQKNANSAPSGNVVFKQGNKEISSVVLSKGTAVTGDIELNAPDWTPGNYTLTAEYGGGGGLAPAKSGDCMLTIAKATISEVAVTINPPAAGGKPDMSAQPAAGAQYQATGVMWMDSKGSPVTASEFSYGTIYAVQITLEVKDGQCHQFDTQASGKLNGQSAILDIKPGNTVAVLSYTFPSTGNRVPVYTVIFLSNGGTSVYPMAVASGGKIYRPEDPEREGFIFGGWYREKEFIHAWSFDKDIVTGNLKLFAKWTPVTTPVPDKPEAPSLRLVRNTTTAIALGWDKVEGATGYVVYGYKNRDEAFTYRAIVRGAENITHTQKGIAPGTPERYVVRAYWTVEGKNHYSGQSNLVTTASRPEGARIKKALPKSAGKVYVALTEKPKGATGYAYCLSLNGDYDSCRIVAKGPLMPYTMKNLPKGQNDIMVRPYVRDYNGKSVYGEWSQIVKVKVK